MPAVIATEAECVKWSADFGLSITSRLLGSLMKFLRTGKSIRLWINLDTETPDHKRPISRSVASVLMRRRSLQLFLDPAIREFPWIFSAVWSFNSNSHMLQSTQHPEILEFQRLLPYRITIQMGKSSQVVLSSHPQLLLPHQREAARNAMAVKRQQIASRACRSANCVLIARNSCFRDCGTFARSCRASQCQCSFGSCGYQSTC